MAKGLGWLLRALVLLVATSLLLGACGTSAPAPEGATARAPSVDRIRRAGVLRWGGDLQGGEPYVSESPDKPGVLVGFEVDLAEAMARRLGVRAEFVQNDWSNLVPSLERGTFDVILNGLELTPERASRLALSRPYYVFAERLMAKRDDHRVEPRLAALGGLRVGTLSNSYALELLRAESAGAARPIDIVLYEGTEEPYADLAGGRTDAVLLDDIIAVRYGEPKPELRVVGDVGQGHYIVGIRRAEVDLRAAIDAALDDIAKSGELRTILARHQLWNERQERLVAWAPRDQAALVGGEGSAVPAPRAEKPRLTRAQVSLFLRGAGVTLLLSTLAMALAVPLGMALSLARLFGPSPVRAIASAYVEIFRGTPVLLQLYVLYYGLASVVRLDAFTAAVLGLGMNYAAYEAEVYRAGIQAVPRGQWDAAAALAMPLPLALRRIVLPQAFRMALPNVTNDYIALLKDSSLVSVITVVELTKQMTITAVDVRSWLVPGLLCASLYFAMSYPLGVLSRRLEARLARS